MRPPLATTNASYAFADALLGALVAAGVRDLCICPGSRSAPLAAASLEVPGLRRFVHIDERSAAFFAQGLARTRRAPVALLCTSGTAALEFGPAVAEAGLSRVPLVVLTADRPPELRDWGAPQTLHQEHLYGPHVRWFAEAPVPHASLPQLTYARALGARAVSEATGPLPGPVHLNLPLREPLAPIFNDMPVQPPARRVRHLGGSGATEPAVAQLVAFARVARRGVVVAGPEEASPRLVEAATAFASRLGWPLLAECSSQLRFASGATSAPVLACSDALLGCEAFARRQAPDAVLRLGAAPTGKALHRWLARHEQARVAALDVVGGSRDPHQRVDLWLHGAPEELLARALQLLPERPGADTGWQGSFLEAEKRVGELLLARAEAAPLLSAGVARRLFEALPAGATLVLSNSLAVREADSSLPVSSKPVRVVANRGANGIDGVLSTALGASVGAGGPLALLIGDLAFLHDVSALLTARRLELSCTVVVLNDAGGGIFGRLPIAAEGARVGFDELFRVVHETDLGSLVRGFGCEHTQVQDASALDAALRDSLARSGVQVIEVPIDPVANLAAQRACQASVAEALA